MCSDFLNYFIIIIITAVMEFKVSVQGQSEKYQYFS